MEEGERQKIAGQWKGRGEENLLLARGAAFACKQGEVNFGSGKRGEEARDRRCRGDGGEGGRIWKTHCSFLSALPRSLLDEVFELDEAGWRWRWLTLEAMKSKLGLMEKGGGERRRRRRRRGRYLYPELEEGSIQCKLLAVALSMQIAVSGQLNFAGGQLEVHLAPQAF